MKRTIQTVLLAAIWTTLLMLGSLSLQAQDEDTQPEKDTRPVRNLFESIWLIDNQTAVVPIKGTLEMDIQHRFGAVNDNKFHDLYGLFAASNIRLGFNYVPIDKLQVGFGFTKEKLLWDFNAKYAIFQQGREGGSPVSVTYFVNMGIDTRLEKQYKFDETVDRFTYFHQLMIARKITDDFSLQASGSLSWFNFRELNYDAEGTPLGRDGNRHFNVAFLGRYKVTPTLGLIANVDLPITDQEFIDEKPNISFGVEMVSSSHAFQIFLGRYKSLVPQYNNMLNQNSDFMIGFNMTRLWNF